MNYAFQYIRSAVAILSQYDGSVPFSVFLKQYFSANKKFGSKDRRNIAHLCYSFFRTGHAVVADLVEEKIKAALFLCEQKPGIWEQLYTEEWLQQWETDIDTKWNFISDVWPGSDQKKIFPWVNELSDGIDTQKFINSHLIQPDLFFRTRPGSQKAVSKKLAEKNIPFTLLSETCFALPNASKIDEVIDIDKEAVIQDHSSQRVTEFFDLIEKHTTITIWDCCAASGGKSLLAYDVLQDTELTVSDVRPLILKNLAARFERAGVKNYHSFIADLTKREKIPASKYKLVICDAPCTGSGTWGRTPEQLYFFAKEKIDHYTTLQKKILSRVIPSIENNGYLLYITCSVFKKENEEAVSFIQQQPNLELIKMELLKGYDQKADTMFGALFRLRE